VNPPGGVLKENFYSNVWLGPLFEDALRNVLEMAKEMMGARQGGIMFYEPDERLLSLQFPAFDVRREMVYEYRVRADGVGAAVKAFNTRQPFISNRCVGDPNVIQRYVEMYRVEKLMTVPLECGAEVIGIWHLSNKREGDWEAGDAARFKVMARQLSGLIEQARQVKMQEKRYQIWLSLMQKLADSGDVQSVAEVLAHVLNTSVVVLDGWGVCRAKAGRSADQFLLTEKNMKFLNSFINNPRCVPAQVFPDLKNGFSPPAWVIPLPPGTARKSLGCLLLLAGEGRCVDEILLNQAAYVLAVALANEDRLAGVIETLSSDFLERLLKGALDKTEAYLRAGRLGLDLSRCWRMLLIVPDRAPMNNDEMQNLWRKLNMVKNLLVHQLANQPQEYWVGLLQNCSMLVLAGYADNSVGGTVPGELPKMIRQLLKRFIWETTFSIGIGEVICREPTHYAEAYREAKWTAEIGRRINGPGAVSYASDFGASFLLYEASRSSVAKTLVDRLLCRLVEHDRRYNSQLMATLETYLETGENIAATARLLHTHVNTVRYRLGRIEEITGRSLKNARNRFDFQIALQTRKLRG